MPALPYLHAMTPEKWVSEHRFAKDRGWKFDYACVRLKIAIEVEGGAWTRGRHTRGPGFINDMEKYNCAAIAGWLLLRFTPRQMADGTFQARLEQAIESRTADRWSEAH